MRGVNSVIGFGVLGIFAVALISYLSPMNGFCGEKSLPCRGVVSADPGVVVEVIARGMVGLIMIMLIANGLAAWLSFRSRQV